MIDRFPWYVNTTLNRTEQRIFIHQTHIAQYIITASNRIEQYRIEQQIFNLLNTCCSIYYYSVEQDTASNRIEQNRTEQNRIGQNKTVKNRGEEERREEKKIEANCIELYETFKNHGQQDINQPVIDIPSLHASTGTLLNNNQYRFYTKTQERTERPVDIVYSFNRLPKSFNRVSKAFNCLPKSFILMQNRYWLLLNKIDAEGCNNVISISG